MEVTMNILCSGREQMNCTDLISNALLKMLGWNGTSLNRQKNKFVKIN